MPLLKATTSRFSRIIHRLVNPIFYGKGAPYYLMRYYDGKLICPATFIHALSRPVIWEPESRHYLEEHIQKGDVAIDVGACFGLYTFLFSRLVGREGVVYAFEPDPFMYKILCKNISLNHLTNIIVSRKALSNCNGITRFYLSTGGASSIQPMQGLRSAINVDVKTIDSFNFEKADWIKIDTEGTEHLILEGAKETLRRCSPRMLIEFLPVFGNTDKLLQALEGWNIQGLDNNILCEPNTYS